MPRFGWPFLGRAARALPLACLAVLASGCGRMREVSACRSLARDVNQTLTEIEALSKTRGPDQELRIAKNYAALAKRIEPKSTDTTPMATLLREYVTVLRATDSALKNHAEATRSQQTPRVNESRRELDRLVKRERSAVTRIDVECHQ